MSASTPDGPDSLVYSANVVAITGPSGRWGFWGERDTGVAVIRGMPEGLDSFLWQERFGPLLPVGDALEDYIAPNFSRGGVPDDFSAALRRNYP